MDRVLFFRLPTFCCKVTTLHLAFSWIAGLVIGSIFSLSASNMLICVMRASVFSRLSIFGLLSVLALPMLFSAFAVYISQPVLLIPIAFCKAFLFSYTSIGILTAFGSAGWLIHLLFMFGDILTLPLLWYFWSKFLSDNCSHPIRCLLPILITAAFIGYTEYRVISPFLANLIS